MLNIVNKRYLYFGLSLLLIIPGIISLIINGLRPGIDFAGGTAWDVLVPNQPQGVLVAAAREVFNQGNFEGNVNIQVSPPDEQQRVFISARTPAVADGSEQKTTVVQALEKAFPGATLESFDTVGATVSAESRTQAVIAVLAASVAILVYLTLAFRKAPHPIRFGVAAIAAMLHDVLLVVGLASILGYLIGLEADALFLTALLTVISFSVHDTIVVFDRVRENLLHRRSDQSFEEVVNVSIVQTLARSINTQLTSLLTLLALLFFGGATIRDFVLILTIGLISGTYSSLFNAAQILVVWENGWGRDWKLARRRQSVATATA